jgi:hypothetical protein
MIGTALPFLDRLKAAADEADKAEDAYRREAAQRIKTLERERSFAYRRLNLMKSAAQALAQLPKDTVDEKIAVASAQRVLRDKLGWASDSAPRLAVLGRFGAIGAAMLAAHDGARPATAQNGATEEAEALAAFEAWYEEAHGSPFWVLFEHYMPETPLVDF